MALKSTIYKAELNISDLDREYYADHSLTLELSWPTSASPDAIKAALEAAGVRAEVLGLTPRAGEVDGRLRLQPVAAKPAKPGAPS